MPVTVTSEHQEPAQQDPEAAEPPPSLPAYFGGYALIFGAVVGVALLLALAARCPR
jgi:hypothetical protein